MLHPTKKYDEKSSINHNFETNEGHNKISIRQTDGDAL